VDIRIGITNSPREINFESAQTVDEVEKIIEQAITSGSPVKLRDDKDKLYIVPIAAFGYIEIGSEQSRRVGFVA
jgi:hypothetical protein